MLELAHDCLETVRDIERAAVRLTANIEQHRIDPLGGDHVIPFPYQYDLAM